MCWSLGIARLPTNPIQGNADVTFNPSSEWCRERNTSMILPSHKGFFQGKITQKDFNFEKPSLDLTAKEAGQILSKTGSLRLPWQVCGSG